MEDCREIHKEIDKINRRRIALRMSETGGQYNSYDSTYTCNKCHKTLGMRVLFNDYEVIPYAEKFL